MIEKYKIFKVLSSDIRLKIFQFLLDGKMCVSGIMDKLNVTQPTVTQHLKILQEIGLVKSEKSGYWMHYSIDEEGLSKIKNEILEFVSNMQVQQKKCCINALKCPEKHQTK